MKRSVLKFDTLCSIGVNDKGPLSRQKLPPVMVLRLRFYFSLSIWYELLASSHAIGPVLATSAHISLQNALTEISKSAKLTAQET